jgi:hypothetical protein
MSTRAPQGETCAAYGCPMIAAIGIAGQWYCACHWREPVAAFDAITAELHRQKPLVARATAARQTHAGFAAICAAENELIALTHELGQQYALTPHERPHNVIGPTHGDEHWTHEAEET